jgi:hypothetical protein
MFAWLPDFNGDVSALDTSNAEKMHGMFQLSPAFNNPSVMGFDTSLVESMDWMFSEATSFNQDISQWCVKNITSTPTNFADGTALIADHTPGWGGCPAEGIPPLESSKPPEIIILSPPSINSFGGNNAVSTGTTAEYQIIGEYTEINYKWEYQLDDAENEWEWLPDWQTPAIAYDGTAQEVTHTYNFPANTIYARLACGVEYVDGEYWVTEYTFSDVFDVATGQPVTRSATGPSRAFPNSDVLKWQKYDVSVVSTGYGNKFALNGTTQRTVELNFNEGVIFDQSDSSNSGHPLRIYEDSARTIEVTAGVKVSGSLVYFRPETLSGTFYYQCPNHADMGGVITT